MGIFLCISTEAGDSDPKLNWLSQGATTIYCSVFGHSHLRLPYYRYEFDLTER